MTDGGEAIITEELRGWIGRKNSLLPLEVITAADIRRYVDATGDANPLWSDDEFARSAGYKGRILPPTLVGWVPFSLKELSDGSETGDLRRQLPLPRDYTNVRNAGSEIEWLQPAYLGEKLTPQSCIVSFSPR